MACEKGPADADLVSIDLAHITQISKEAETVDDSNVIRADIDHGSFASTLEDPIEEILIQASVTEEERVGIYHQKINNECDINSEGATDDARGKLVVPAESDARRENRVLQKLLRAPRYFDFPLSNWPDDQVKKDTAKEGQKICYICAEVDHSGNRCRKVIYCFICTGKARKKHLVKDCPNKNVELDCASTPCLKCGNTGHNMFSCNSAYDSEDLKAIECYVCKRPGHLCCVENKGEGPIASSCYLCGKLGHFAPECTKRNVVTFDIQLICNKCKERGHSGKNCPNKKIERCNKCKERGHSGKKCPKDKDKDKDKDKALLEKRRLHNARRQRYRKRRRTCNTLSSQPHQGSSASGSHQCHNISNRAKDIQASNNASSSCLTFQV